MTSPPPPADSPSIRADNCAAELRRLTELTSWQPVDSPPEEGGLYQTAQWWSTGWRYDHLLYRTNSKTWVNGYGLIRTPDYWRPIHPQPPRLALVYRLAK